MDYEEFKAKTDRIYKLAIRKKDLALALKCVEMQYRFAQEQKPQAAEKEVSLKNLTPHDIINLMTEIEGEIGISKEKSFRESPLFKKYGHKHAP